MVIPGQVTLRFNHPPSYIDMHTQILAIFRMAAIGFRWLNFSAFAIGVIVQGLLCRPLHCGHSILCDLSDFNGIESKVNEKHTNCFLLIFESILDAVRI